MAITDAPLVLAIIILKPFFLFHRFASLSFKIRTHVPLPLPQDVTTSASNSLETVMVPIHIPLRLYKPAPGSFFSLIPFLQPLATAPIKPSFSRNGFFLLYFLRHFLRV
jgi:hypothetical protein